MQQRAYYRAELALSQLETALWLFAEGRDCASVITLAGAADEIFGNLLKASGRDSSFESLKRAAAEIHLKIFGEPGSPKLIGDRANLARNSLKHWDVGNSELVKFDLAQEARDMLHRAIDNYWTLEQKLSPAMEAFQRADMES